MDVIIEEIIRHTDDRGFVFEPLTADHVGAQRHAHVVLTQPGCVRGNHYHRVGTEVLAVIGAWLVRYRENGAVREIQLGEHDAIRVTIQPGIAHAFKYLGSGQGLLVAFSDLTRDEALADMVKTVLIEP